MLNQPDPADFSGFVVYVRRSSGTQKENYSIDTQRQAIKDAAKLHGLPDPIVYEDDERSTKGA